MVSTSLSFSLVALAWGGRQLYGMLYDEMRMELEFFYVAR